MSFSDQLQARIVRLLRWSEKYTKTDMVYLARAGFWTNANVIIVTVLGFLLSIAFANLLPKAVFGTYQYLISLSAIITALTLAGMNNAVARAVARGKEGDFQHSVRIQLIWSIVPTLAGILLALYYFTHANYEIAVGLAIVAIFSPVTNVFNTYSAFLTGRKDFKRAFFYGTTLNAAYYGAMFIALAFTRSALMLVFINLGINAIATTLLYVRTITRFHPNTDRDPGTMRYGINLSIMNAFSTIAAQLDSLLVFHFLGPIDLAIYSFASTIPERMASLSKFLTPAALPQFANRSVHEIRNGLLSKMLRAAIASTIIAILYVIGSPALFHLLFPQYDGAIFYSQIYSPIIVTTTLIVVSTTALISQRLQRELYIYNVLNPIFLLILQVALVITYGLTGILLARVISGILSVLLSVWLFFQSKTE